MEQAISIAVIMGADGRSASMLDAGAFVRIYRKNAGTEWEAAEDVAVALHPQNGLRAVREEIHGIIGSLGDVRIVVAGQITGAPYNMFDTAGYAIFEIKGRPEEFLDFVAHEIKAQQEVPKAADEVPQPQKAGDDGRYYLDLVKAQREHANATTKQMLLPFLEKTTFYELELICSHIPPWFDRQFGALKLAYDKEAIGPEKYKVTVHPASCE